MPISGEAILRRTRLKGHNLSQEVEACMAPLLMEKGSIPTEFYFVFYDSSLTWRRDFQVDVREPWTSFLICVLENLVPSK